MWRPTSGALSAGNEWEIPLITVIVKYVLPQPVPRAALLQQFRQAEATFRAVPQLIRKYFCYDEPAHTGHSVYLWESEAAARAFFDAAFVAHMRQKFGATPELLFVDTLMVVDNEQGRTTT
jgi:diadenosine tetraphosphatase ApaH/serine/threonine PP2A family protein phosphatase